MELQINFPEPRISGFCISFSEGLIIGSRFCPATEQTGSEPDTQFARKISQVIHHYFQHPEQQLSLPCAITQGTAFQQKVWLALAEIPAGQVKTYGQLANELGTSARAVGNACRRNLFPLIIPCHRAVSATGIGGFAGDTLNNQKGEMNFMQIKQWLLQHEKASY